MKHNAKTLRKIEVDEELLKNIKRNPIYFVLDNVLDTYNIGSIFRLGDALAVTKIYLCGGTETPPSSRIHKAAVGTENWVPWVYKKTALEAVKELKSMGVQVVSIEQDPRSVPLSKLSKSSKPQNLPIAFVVGHETTGVSKEVLEYSDLIVELPMFGVNKSFNVWGSLAVVAYGFVHSITGTFASSNL